MLMTIRTTLLKSRCVFVVKIVVLSLISGLTERDGLITAGARSKWLLRLLFSNHFNLNINRSLIRGRS
jgi:hypothetical protein